MSGDLYADEGDLAGGHAGDLDVDAGGDADVADGDAGGEASGSNTSRNTPAASRISSCRISSLTSPLFRSDHPAERRPSRARNRTAYDDGIDGNGIFEGRNIVIDGGPDASDKKNTMLHYLQEHAHKDAIIDTLIVTHPHDDHFPGAESLLRHFQIRTYYDPGYPTAESLPPAQSAGYPARLAPLLARKSKLPPVVINDAVPGEPTRTGLPRLRRDLEINPVDYAIILEGTNDVEEGKAPEALSNVRAMIEAVFGVGAQPILGTITPSCCNHRNILPFGAEIFYNGQLRTMAAADMVPVVDFYDAFTNGPGPSRLDRSSYFIPAS